MLTAGKKPKPFATEADRPLCADDIVNLLAERHSPEKAVFVPECKMGQQGSRRLDAWALLKTWSPLTIIGYEVKVNRQDFVNDRKWEAYLPVCHELYFACPPRLIAPEELPPNVGLLWASGGRLVTRRRALRRPIDHDAVVTLMSYVLMSRARVVADMWATYRETPGEYWRRFVAERREDLEYGRIASKRIAEAFHDARMKQHEAERDRDRYRHIEERLVELGFNPRARADAWSVDRKLTGDAQEMSRAFNRLRLAVKDLERFVVPEAARQAEAQQAQGGEGA